MFKKFLSLFISKAPWRFVYVVLVISIISMGWFAYQNEGDVIGLKASASSDFAYTQENAVQAASNWVYGQTYYGDRVIALNLTCQPSGAGSYDALCTFTSLDFSVDPAGELHHMPANHTVNIRIVDGNVVSVTDGFRDIIRDPLTVSVKSMGYNVN